MEKKRNAIVAFIDKCHIDKYGLAELSGLSKWTLAQKLRGADRYNLTESDIDLIRIAVAKIANDADDLIAALRA